MKKILMIFVIIITTLSAYTQTFEAYGRFTEKAGMEPDINISGSKEISQKLSLSYFALVEQKWSEALLSISCKPYKWMQVGIGAGIEQNTDMFRTCASLILEKGNSSFMVLLEKGDGPDNYWYKILISQKISPELTVGIMDWRYHGIGPIFKYSPPKVHGVTLWAMPAFDSRIIRQRLMIGIDINMRK